MSARAFFDATALPGGPAPGADACRSSRLRCIDSEYLELPTMSLDSESLVTASKTACSRTLISRLLRLAAGGSYRERGSELEFHRTYPTSGNLQSVHTYVVADELTIKPTGLNADANTQGTVGSSAVFHYDPSRHAVGKLGKLQGRMAPSTGFFVALTSSPGRQVRKYGRRGLRYAWLDLGHAIRAFEQAAFALELQLVHVPWQSCEVSRVLSLDFAPTCCNYESEVPGALLHFELGIEPKANAELGWRRLVAGCPMAASSETRELISFDELQDDLRWSMDVWKSMIPALETHEMASATRPKSASGVAHALIVRRSPRAFDSTFQLSERAHRAVLAAAEDVQCCRGLILTRVFYIVHNVEGLAPGLYEGASGSSKGRVLHLGDLREDAEFMTAYQVKAANCALLVVVTSHGAMEIDCGLAHVAAGMIGQEICIAATSNGTAASGLGAFFDAPASEFLAQYGIETQALYWIAVGSAA
jgi:nitroreductase